MGMALSPVSRNDASTTANTARRAFLQKALMTAVAVPMTAALPSAAQALDMDAFVASSLTPSQPASMSDDEALCKFGAPSKQTGEACLRAGLSTKRAGTLDAFGQVDRGNYVRCKQFYGDDGKGGYEKKTECDGPR